MCHRGHITLEGFDPCDPRSHQVPGVVQDGPVPVGQTQQQGEEGREVRLDLSAQH